VRLPARRFLSTEYIAVNADPAPLLERGALPTSLPWTLREALSIDPENAGDATADMWLAWYDDWAASVYADIRRHADWLVDDGFTDSLLRALAMTMPETAEAAYATVRSRCTAVLGRLLAADLSTGSMDAIVGALWECPPSADAQSDERAVRDRLGREIVAPHLSDGSLICWSAVDEEDFDPLALVVATRHAVDALPGTAAVPALLVAEHRRSAAAAALRFSVPEVRVLSLEDVPLDIPVNAEVLNAG
jgi:flagellar biosynthesis component FlhA